VSYTRIYALGVLYQTKVVYPFKDTKSDTMNREVNLNFYDVVIEFYKFYVTVIMNKYNRRFGNMKRIVCLIIAVGMILSAVASGILMFF